MQTETQNQVHIPDAVAAEVVDRLIPGPWPTWRRLGFLTIAGALLIAGSIAWFGGWVHPNVSARANEWGGAGPVTLAVRLTNDGPRPLEVQSVEEPAGLQLRTLEATPVTVRCTDLGDGGSSCTDEFGTPLAPGRDIVVAAREAMVLRATYDVLDCGALDRADTTYDVVLRYESGVPWWSTTQQFYTGDWGLFGAAETANPSDGWPFIVTQYACGVTPIEP